MKKDCILKYVGANENIYLSGICTEIEDRSD
jgi:hypothetical protein